jgi:hypothetical protein
VLQAALGLEADVQGGTFTVAPTFARNYGSLSLNGFQVKGNRQDVTVTADGSAQVTAPGELAVTMA